MNNQNFVATVILSILILVGFHYMYEKPQMEKLQQQQMAQKLEAETKKDVVAIETPKVLRDRTEILRESARVAIDTPELSGSINLKGARLDDLALRNYHETVDRSSPNIVIFSPSGSAAPHHATYASFGWLGDEGAVPDNNTLWKAEGKKLEVGKPLRLTWDNGKGLVFERLYSLDENFLFTVTDRVTNKGSATPTLYPFGLIARQGKPKTEDTYVLHEGPIGVLQGKLTEFEYKDLMEVRKQALESEGGWLGITDKYWLMALLPPQKDKLAASFTFDPTGSEKPEEGLFQTDYRGTAVSLAPGATIEKVQHLFAGAKRVRLLDQVEKQLGLPNFDRAIDFGWYYFLTKPFLYLLDILGNATGNFGWAIVIFTILLKIATYPLSMKSYRSMARMKEIQPEITRLQEKYADDRQQLGLATMELYKREKINPMSGCLPMLIQIPIFFALYKVLYVGIELRHAPLFGWVHDLSAPDPTSVLTAFGLLDWSFMPHLGVWPVLMGISMYAQQKLSPQPTDKSQATAFKFLPLIFTFMMGSVASGLIFYWTWSNILGLGQQWLIMHKSGVKKATS